MTRLLLRPWRVTALLAALATMSVGCNLFATEPLANVGDGPAEAQCAEFEDQARPSWCPGGTVHLAVRGNYPPTARFALISTDPESGGSMTELRALQVTDAPPGTYHAFVALTSAEPCSDCSLGPPICEAMVEVPAFGKETSITIAFTSAGQCSISVP